ncbi:rRNA maturation RNase YbeY [bacterium]|nr:rRNA maturation RNase YbeY [bacterium]
MLTFFNPPPFISPSVKQKLSKVVKKQFKEVPISIIFVDLKKITRLNNEYRKLNEPTDVLSFNYDTKELLGEVYVCIEYIKANSAEIRLEEEVIRLILHGILHLYGYDHSTHFVDRTQTDLENMYILQESMLDQVIKK